MAAIKVVGNAVVITSSLRFEDILAVQKYCPSALTLMGGEDGKQPIFKVEACKGADGKINIYGATFGSATHDDKELATITLHLSVPADADVTAVKEFIADEYGMALSNLKRIEDAIPGVLEAVRAERTAFMSAVTVE